MADKLTAEQIVYTYESEGVMGLAEYLNQIDQDTHEDLYFALVAVESADRDLANIMDRVYEELEDDDG